MIILNKEHPYSLKNFDNYNKKLDFFYLLLEKSNKPKMKNILELINKNKINIMYSNEEKDIRILVPSKDNNSVEINISNMTKNLDNSIEKKNLPLGELYSYLIQGYCILKWDELEKDRELIEDAIQSHAKMMMSLVTFKGIGLFRNDQDVRKFKFLSMWYIIKKSYSKSTDPTGLAKRLSGYEDTEKLITLYEKIYDDKELDLSKLLYFVLQKEYKFMEKIESVNYLVHVAYRLYGPSGAYFIDELKYFAPLCLDFTQTSNPIVYNSFPALNNIIPKTAYHNVYSVMREL